MDFDAVLKGRKHEQSQKPWDTDLQFNREIKLTNKNSAKINQKFTVRQKGGGGAIAPSHLP